ncbi:uncharacterized protein MONOS_7519 [Monocercomonoides exilis]|uniref:uncharacterized protein n=1 Tax=Monocercomonoides exilis TaxID=2049356 RepID=UPI0035598843|nr:hypothetical protein MONOS_7519 [Monocercomonoides exilis]|eukprot:MONOS_7519.1-p1 / transcript=MONOS_7519.1 / gene=MONOS_7519 / organism=Monocercomonoides_exilis_PA203 / gene_product=unspecified product / transcript_product=unspecified product / location=Mono_scaffold00259:6824-11725(+) / protein_length=1102 / sequence_SO=supercontig / SO=protein_coding / is_pseudo=false
MSRTLSLSNNAADIAKLSWKNDGFLYFGAIIGRNETATKHTGLGFLPFNQDYLSLAVFEEIFAHGIENAIKNIEPSIPIGLTIQGIYCFISDKQKLEQHKGNKAFQGNIAQMLISAITTFHKLRKSAPQSDGFFIWAGSTFESYSGIHVKIDTAKATPITIQQIPAGSQYVPIITVFPLTVPFNGKNPTAGNICEALEVAIDQELPQTLLFPLAPTPQSSSSKINNDSPISSLTTSQQPERDGKNLSQPLRFQCFVPPMSYNSAKNSSQAKVATFSIFASTILNGKQPISEAKKLLIDNLAHSMEHRLSLITASHSDVMPNDYLLVPTNIFESKSVNFFPPLTVSIFPSQHNISEALSRYTGEFGEMKVHASSSGPTIVTSDQLKLISFESVPAFSSGKIECNEKAVEKKGEKKVNSKPVTMLNKYAMPQQNEEDDEDEDEDEDEDDDDEEEEEEEEKEEKEKKKEDEDEDEEGEDDDDENDEDEATSKNKNEELEASTVKQRRSGKQSEPSKGDTQSSIAKEKPKKSKIGIIIGSICAAICVFGVSVELPGDASAPKNFSRDFKAFKDFEVLPSVKQKRKEMDEYMSRKPIGSKSGWDFTTTVRSSAYDKARSRELSRHQPLERDIEINLHSPQPLKRNPLVFDPKPSKFAVPGSYSSLGLREDDEEKEEIFTRSLRPVSTMTGFHTLRSFRSQSTNPTVRERSFGKQFNQDSITSRSQNDAIIPSRMPLPTLAAQVASSGDVSLSKVPFVARFKTHCTASDDPVPDVEWSTSTMIDMEERRRMEKALKEKRIRSMEKTKKYFEGERERIEKEREEWKQRQERMRGQTNRTGALRMGYSTRGARDMNSGSISAMSAFPPSSTRRNDKWGEEGWNDTGTGKQTGEFYFSGHEGWGENDGRNEALLGTPQTIQRKRRPTLMEREKQFMEEQRKMMEKKKGKSGISPASLSTTGNDLLPMSVTSRGGSTTTRREQQREMEQLKEELKQREKEWEEEMKKKDVGLMEMEAERKAIWKEMRERERRRRRREEKELAYMEASGMIDASFASTKTRPCVKVERFHPGTYGPLPLQEEKGWSCCMASSPDAPGCEKVVKRSDKWSLEGV